MNKIATYNLISSIISLLNSEDFVSTIPAMADSCNVPLQYMRRTMLKILDNVILSSCIDSDDYNDPEDPEATILDTYYDDKVAFSNNLLAGKYDDITWELNLKILSDEQILPLSTIEYSALGSLGEDKLSLCRGALCEKKDNINKLSKLQIDNLEQIQIAIDNSSYMHFSYKNAKGEISNPTCCPIKVITNVADNWIYIQSIKEDSDTNESGFPAISSYRLDRISSPVKIMKKYKPVPDIEPNPYEKYIWGAFYEEGLEPEHVKLRIQDNTSNIISKIKNDTRHRQATCKLYQKGEYFYYEDDIIGIDEFHRWLRSYGSSIQVLEPAKLREKIIAAAETTLDYYSWIEKWKDL